MARRQRRQEPSHTFKVGDRVVIDQFDSDTGLQAGDVGIVEQLGVERDDDPKYDPTDEARNLLVVRFPGIAPWDESDEPSLTWILGPEDVRACDRPFRYTPAEVASKARVLFEAPDGAWARLELLLDQLGTSAASRS